MNNLFRQHALSSYGEEGKLWIERIPSIIEIYEEKWSLHVLPPYNLTYNYITPAERSDGSRAVLKVGYPKDKEFQSEIDMLTVCNGEGVVRLLQADRPQAVILIEEVIPGTPLSTISDDTQATKILTSVMEKIWKPLPSDKHFVHIAQWAQALYDYPNEYKNYPNPPISLTTVYKAIQILEELLKTSAPPVLTHADLHHDNILKSDRGEWLAIDPKGIAAEPCYDTTAMIRNPYKLLNTMPNIDELLRNRIQVMSKELNFDPKRIRKWCFVQTVLSGVWTRDDPSDTAHAMKVALSLERIQ